jgi:hypothetical protein
MKKILFLFVTALICSFGLFASQANAQICTNNCITATTTVTISYSLAVVQGYSRAEADYTAGLNYDPGVEGAIQRTDMPETNLDYRISRGSGSSRAAVINLATFNFVDGKRYCNYSNYYAVRHSTNYWHFIGPDQDCKTIMVSSTPTPTPTPTPTITPTPTPTPTPTITPTPTPGPTPTVRITEVGFTGDRKIKQLKVAGNPWIEETDGTVPTWKATANPKFPVAYLKGTSPTLWAKFSITPTLTTSQSAQIRVLNGNIPLTSSPMTATLIGSEVRVNNIGIPFSNLEPDPRASVAVRKTDYEFTWQISFDNGNTWRNLDKKTEHDIHWLYSNPTTSEDTFQTFKNGDGGLFYGLFDVALEYSTGATEKIELDDQQQFDINKVIQKINIKVKDRVNYVPSIDSYDDNPLRILIGENGLSAVCQDNAFIFLGLLTSIGLPVRATNPAGVGEQFHWGGQESTGKRNYYCPPGGCTDPDEDSLIGNRISMQTKRNQLGCGSSIECVPRNPSFAYHATVKYAGKVYDPSYGLEENGLDLLTAINVPPTGTPQCVRGNDATRQLVTRITFGNWSLGANNDTMRTCTPVLSFIHADAKLFRFDSFGGADIAVVRGKTGEWVVQNEFQENKSLLALPFNPMQDALAPADYDGDGLTDPAVWYANGDFFYRMSSNYYKVSPSFWRVKGADEKAVPGDYDGDRISDIAGWRPSDGKWFIRRSSDNTDVEIQWGMSGDVPVPGDYDNDGKTDAAIWRPSTGDWWILKSSDSGYSSLHWGMEGDIPVQGDYDGDGTTDYAVVRPSTGVWYFLESENGYQFRAYQGPVLEAEDIPVPADYNADSETDVAVFFRSNGMWHIVDSQTGEIRTENLGGIADTPVMAASVFK